jgi:hypothetical protein
LREKHILNKLIDEMVHGSRPPKTLDQIVIDECLHAVVEGGFKPKKFIRYTVLPLFEGEQKRRRKRWKKYWYRLILASCVRSFTYVTLLAKA